jgi:hypothetical protein
MNNEPVAWFEQDPDMKSIWYQSEQDNSNAIPLYTHPMPNEILDTRSYLLGRYDSAKTLTDEEIIKVYEDMLGVASARSSAIEFARAILKKASEK